MRKYKYWYWWVGGKMRKYQYTLFALLQTSSQGNHQQISKRYLTPLNNRAQISIFICPRHEFMRKYNKHNQYANIGLMFDLLDQYVLLSEYLSNVW